MEHPSRSLDLAAGNSCIAWSPALADVLVHTVTTVTAVSTDLQGRVCLRISATGSVVFDGGRIASQQPRLIARCYPAGPPHDGIWEFAFCCVPPHTKVLQCLTPVMASLDWLDYASQRQRLKGIAVRAQANSQTVLLASAEH